MTSLSYTPANGANADGDELAAVHSELLAFATSIPANSLQGGIRQDQIADRFVLSNVSKQIVSSSPDGDLTSGSGLVIDTTERWAGRITHRVRPNWEAYLCSINVYVLIADSTAAVNWNLEVRKQSGAVVGQRIIVDGSLDDRNYLIAKPDFVAAPLESFSDGEYFDVFIWASAGTPTPRGVEVDFLFKSALAP